MFYMYVNYLNVFYRQRYCWRVRYKPYNRRRLILTQTLTL